MSTDIEKTFKRPGWFGVGAVIAADSDKTVSRIRFIKRAKNMGFKLREIEELLKLDDGHCEDARALAEEKCQFIEEQIADLVAMREILGKLIKGCDTHPLGSHCPIIENMDDSDIGI